LTASRKMNLTGLGAGATTAAVRVVDTPERRIHPFEKMIEQPQHQRCPAAFEQARDLVKHALDARRPIAHLVIFEIVVRAGGFGDGLPELCKQGLVIRRRHGDGKLQLLQQFRITLGKAHDHLDKAIKAS
jgi:hypothetical protein